MEREITIHLDLRLSPRMIIGGLTAALMVGLAGDLGSESVSLTTYYPAPSGVYTQMLTTNATYLARNSGSVAIGLTNPDANTKLAVRGAMAVGDAAFSAAAAPTNGIIVKGLAGFGTSNPSSGIHSGGRVRLGVGSTNVDAALGRSYLFIDNSNTSCTLQSYSGSGNICTGSPEQYATFTPGVYIAGNTYQDRGGPVYAEYGGGTTTKVWGWSVANPSGMWMTLGKDDTDISVYCCEK